MSYKDFLVTMLAGAAFALLPFSQPFALAADEKPIVLKAANYYPDAGPIGHDIHAATFDFIEKEMKGRIKLDRYFSGSLHSLADGYKAMRSGLSDICQAYVFSNPRAFDYMNGDSLPFLFNSAVAATAALDEIYPKYFKKEYEKQGCLIAFQPVFNYNVLISRKPVRTKEDLAGLKVMAHGAMMRQALDALGATTVFVSPQDMFIALQRGVIDAITFGSGCIVPWRFHEVAKYCTEINLFRNTINFAISPRAYKRLPKDVQADLYRTFRYTGNHMSELYDKLDSNGYEVMKRNGVEIIRLSPEEQARWREAVVPMWDEFAEELNKKGLDGDGFVRDIKAAADKFNAMTTEEIREYTRTNYTRGMIDGQ